MTQAPDRKQLAGLTFATVDEKMDTDVRWPRVSASPRKETPTEHRINMVFSLLLLAP